MNLPEYLKKSMINLRECKTYGAEDIFAETFFLFLNEAYEKGEITEETKKLLIDKSTNNFKDFEF